MKWSWVIGIAGGLALLGVALNGGKQVGAEFLDLARLISLNGKFITLKKDVVVKDTEYVIKSSKEDGQNTLEVVKGSVLHMINGVGERDIRIVIEKGKYDKLDIK